MKPRTSSTRGRRRAGPFRLACAAMALLPMLAACARFVEVHRSDLLKERPVRRIAVLPFATDLYVERTKGTFEPVVTCLIEGRRYAGGLIPKTAPDEVTAAFVQQLTLRGGGYELVLPGETQAFVDRQGLDAATLDPATFFMAIGQGLKVDAVVAGNVLRFDELRGSAYGAERSASVAIDTHLMDARTGALLWEGSYQEAQATLSENVASFGTLVQRGAKFLTASQLATWAVEQILEEFPRPGETGKNAPEEAAP
ncbi:MAG: hypothetical protein Q8R92_20015 [Deltaproteobacteria bacterium]|nr:hypothetical protein [Deltaproteobacteria bacterium]